MLYQVNAMRVKARGWLAPAVIVHTLTIDLVDDTVLTLKACL